MRKRVPGPLRVLLAGAQTGGHLYPAVAVGRRLVERGAEVTLVASGEPAERDVLVEAGLRVEVLKVGKLNGIGLGVRVRALAGMPGSLLRARSIVSRVDPDVAVGFGGFTTGPLLLAASLCGVPVAICEENSIPGLTNRILSRFATRVFVGYDEAGQRLGASKAVRTGTPVRPALLDVPAKAWSAPGRRVFVFGGSQGSKFLNDRLPSVLARVAERIDGLSVLHQTGRGKDLPVRAAYEDAAFPVQVVEYVQGMADAYRDADFVVARSGAGTVSEVAAIGIPALFVPFAAAADNHQVANARPLVERGAAFLIEEASFDEAAVAARIAGALADPSMLTAMASASRAWSARDALDRMTAEIEALGAATEG